VSADSGRDRLAVADGSVPLAALQPNATFLYDAAVRERSGLAIFGVRAAQGVAR
jgi:hypothetical protein